MGKLRNNQSGFGAIEVLLALILVAIVVLIGVYVQNNRKDAVTPAKTVDTTNTATPPAAKTTETISDVDQIVAAVKSYKGNGTSQQDVTIDKSKIVIDGDNAQGNFGFPEGSGAGFIAHRTNGTWAVVWEGQEGPGSSIGTKYNLPKTWYTTDYQ